MQIKVNLKLCSFNYVLEQKQNEYVYCVFAMLRSLCLLQFATFTLQTFWVIF